ncbi:Uncharacterised protein [Escherichia coli]|uniref:Uncharacterized protein n=1 Tax=Escherichia coli TaxID=562 RepID=A0A376TWV1_ECOLX|nr:Uncharacterised protein [Escherichia coli]
MVTGVSRSPVQAITLPQAFELLVDVLRGFYRRVKKFAESISDQFRARILNKISFAGLGNQRQR